MSYTFRIYSSFSCKSVSFNNVSLISPLPAPINHHFTHFLWVQLLQIPHINDIIQYLSSSVWFMSQESCPQCPSMLSHGRISLFLFVEQYSISMYTHLLYPFIPWRHLDCFHLVAVVSNVAINMAYISLISCSQFWIDIYL